MNLTGGGQHVWSKYKKIIELDQYLCSMVQTGYSKYSKIAFQNVAKYFFDSLHKEGN